MLLRARSKTALCLSVVSFLFTPAIAKHQKEPDVALTCDHRVIDAESYEMATMGQARLAERALERDPRNMMAHSTLARQYAILGREREAIDAWTRVAEGGGVVVWTATLYDVDYQSYFLMSFGRDALRIYRMGQFTGPIDKRLGHAQFPQPTELAFYEATAGCPDSSVTPMLTIPWSSVNELRSGNWVLWFKLAHPVTLTSDRGKKKTLRDIKVNLHGETGEVKILAERNPDFEPDWDEEGEAFRNVRGIGLGPWDYNRRIRDMILRFAEPAGHIKRTSAGRGAGW